MVGMLLDAGADVHVKTDDDRDALAVAKGMGHADETALPGQHGVVVRQ
jgi:hypothetical protein